MCRPRALSLDLASSGPSTRLVRVGVIPSHCRLNERLAKTWLSVCCGSLMKSCAVFLPLMFPPVVLRAVLCAVHDRQLPLVCSTCGGYWHAHTAPSLLQGHDGQLRNAGGCPAQARCRQEHGLIGRPACPMRGLTCHAACLDQQSVRRSCHPPPPHLLSAAALQGSSPSVCGQRAYRFSVRSIAHVCSTVWMIRSISASVTNSNGT